MSHKQEQQSCWWGGGGRGGTVGGGGCTGLAVPSERRCTLGRLLGYFDVRHTCRRSGLQHIKYGVACLVLIIVPCAHVRRHLLLPENDCCTMSAVP